jgi:hypothetical protein
MGKITPNGNSINIVLEKPYYLGGELVSGRIDVKLIAPVQANYLAVVRKKKKKKKKKKKIPKKEKNCQLNSMIFFIMYNLTIEICWQGKDENRKHGALL